MSNGKISKKLEPLSMLTLTLVKEKCAHLERGYMESINAPNFHMGFCSNILEVYCRVIGPAMPSAELLAAAAKLTEAEAELRYRYKQVALFVPLESFYFLP